MSHIEPVEYSNFSEMLSNYKRIAGELRGKSKKRVRLPPVPPIQKKLKVQWKTPVGEFTECGIRWREHYLVSIMREVAEKHNVSVRDIMGGSRTRREITPRLEFYYRAAAETNFSIPAIGRQCGDRDHSTVRWGIIKYCRLNAIPATPRGIGPRRRKSLDIANSN